MKIFDCTTYFDEELMMDVRFNILNERVEKFIVVESLYSHSGKKKKLNFDINNFKKFKDKIIYITIENEPEGLNFKNNKRLNSLKRVEQSYNYMLKGIKEAADNDLIIISDNDEIPNLESPQFLNSKSNIIIFKQLFFYYKFNLFYDAMPWYGSKACKKNKLLSGKWLRNLKNKKYPFWRLDTWFSETKYQNLEIIENGGWHFTNLKTPKKLYEKFKNFGHHDEFEESNIDVEFIKEKINKHEVFYDHSLDQKNPNKWKNNHKLKKIEFSKLPKYINDNKNQLTDWLV